MTRISDFLPGLYLTEENELLPFLNALEYPINDIEKKISDLPMLTDVDRCPPEYLPYLASITNVPLIGDDPRLWRRQIRNWPWLLKIKGTSRSLEVFLDSIGAKMHRIPTYFRDADGSYTEVKPAGEPFLASDGLWRNIRTHYFDLEVTWESQHYMNWRAWNEEFISKVRLWLERAKPFHAELLRWVSILKHDSLLQLYHSVVMRKTGEKRIGLPELPARNARVHAGAAIKKYGHKRININHRTQIWACPPAGAAILKGGTKTIGLSKADKLLLN